MYQHLLTGVASYEELGNRILRRIEAAYAFRQVEQVRELARLLTNIPLREFQLIAQYYLVWCKCRELEYRNEVLERIIEQTQTYKAQGLLSLGTFEISQGNTERALYFYTEALKASPNNSEYLVASRALATAKAMEGFHASALRDLERLIPLLRYAAPLNYFEVINSYAVELIEDNRLSEAHDAALVAVSSPFGPFYPEWQETLADVRSKRRQRSNVAFSRSQIEQE